MLRIILFFLLLSIVSGVLYGFQIPQKTAVDMFCPILNAVEWLQKEM